MLKEKLRTMYTFLNLVIKEKQLTSSPSALRLFHFGRAKARAHFKGARRTVNNVA